MHLSRPIFLALPLLLIILPTTGVSGNLLEIAELLAHPEQYDRQEIVVTGQVTNLQLATNRQGQPAYGFLLKDHAGTLKVISLGQAEVREGEQVIVEGVFSRLRQAGRTIIYNEIKATSIKSINRLNPDLVG
jgi:cytochrome c-type biogenesis protein CcmE